MLASFRPYPETGGRGTIFVATVAVTAMPAYTATAVAGPLIYNGAGAHGVAASILSMSYGLTTASTAAVAIGIAAGVTTAPTSTSTTGLITACTDLSAAPPSPKCSIYTSGTVSAAATLWMPTGQVGTAALTAEIADDNVIPLGGIITLKPGTFAVPAASATMTTGVMQISIMWIEVPIEA